MKIEKLKVLYFTPVFLAWLPGITWDRTMEGRRAALRSFYLFFIFLLATVAGYVLYSTLFLFFSDKTPVRIFAYYYQGVVGIAYLAVSLFQMVLEYLEKDSLLPYPDDFLNRISGENRPQEQRDDETT